MRNILGGSKVAEIYSVRSNETVLITCLLKIFMKKLNKHERINE